MIEMKSSRDFVNRLRRDVEGIKGHIGGFHRRLVATMFVDLVHHTPQWSGNLATQWTIEVHGKTSNPAELAAHRVWSRYASSKNGSLMDRVVAGMPIYQMGDDPAVTTTLNREAGKLAEIKWNSKVAFVNKAPYAQEIEDNPGYIRPENIPASYGRVAMVGYLNYKYKHLGTLKSIFREEMRQFRKSR